MVSWPIRITLAIKYTIVDPFYIEIIVVSEMFQQDLSKIGGTLYNYLSYH